MYISLHEIQWLHLPAAINMISRKAKNLQRWLLDNQGAEMWRTESTGKFCFFFLNIQRVSLKYFNQMEAIYSTDRRAKGRRVDSVSEFLETRRRVGRVWGLSAYLRYLINSEWDHKEQTHALRKKCACFSYAEKELSSWLALSSACILWFPYCKMSGVCLRMS